MTESTDNLPHTGAMIYTDSLVKIPSLAMGLQDADKLAAAVASKKDLHLFISTHAHKVPDTVGYNIIGEWKGTEFPDEYITVGGHLDSWDPAEGASDDGTGCVQSMEVLRALKATGYKPKHSIRICCLPMKKMVAGEHWLMQPKPKPAMKNIYLVWKVTEGDSRRGVLVLKEPMRRWPRFFPGYPC